MSPLDGTCVGCECDLDDWTPRCATCRERRRARARRSGDPSLVAAYHATAAEIEDVARQDLMRRKRDRDGFEFVGGGVGRGGRWVRA